MTTTSTLDFSAISDERREVLKNSDAYATWNAPEFLGHVGAQEHERLGHFSTYVEENDLGRAVAEFKALLTPDTRDYKAELEALWARLGAEANSRNWCDEYDQFASELGGPARPTRRISYAFNFAMALEGELDESDTPVDAFNAQTASERREWQREAITRRLDRAIEYYGGDPLSDAQKYAISRRFADYMSRTATS